LQSRARDDGRPPAAVPRTGALGRSARGAARAAGRSRRAEARHRRRDGDQAEGPRFQSPRYADHPAPHERHRRLSMSAARQLPIMTRAGLSPTHSVTAVDEYGARRELHVAGERPLTLYVDKREIVTLMTLGTQPEALALGYLRNQGLIERLDDVAAVQA